MSKTIEDAAREASMQYCTKYVAYQEPYEIAHTEFLNGAGYMMSLPLASRLTAEEKERVRVLYNEELGMAQHFHARAKGSNDISCRQHYYGLREPYISRMKLLERIFGADFFKEGE